MSIDRARVLIAMLLLTGCSGSMEQREGPMIPEPPPGFAYDGNAGSAPVIGMIVVAGLIWAGWRHLDRARWQRGPS